MDSLAKSFVNLFNKKRRPRPPFQHLEAFHSGIEPGKKEIMTLAALEGLMSLAAL
jgi:hypothetical protein